MVNKILKKINSNNKEEKSVHVFISLWGPDASTRIGIVLIIEIFGHVAKGFILVIAVKVSVRFRCRYSINQLH